MALSTYKTFLMVANELGEYEKLVDIKDYPDIGGLPELLETTTLSDPAQTYIHGIRTSESLVFTANYTKADYTALEAISGVEKDFAIWFGGTEEAGVSTPDGSDGKFEFSGYLSVIVSGGDVNAVREMQISIAPSSSIVVGV